MFKRFNKIDAALLVRYSHHYSPQQQNMVTQSYIALKSLKVIYYLLKNPIHQGYTLLELISLQTYGIFMRSLPQLPTPNCPIFHAEVATFALPSFNVLISVFLISTMAKISVDKLSQILTRAFGGHFFGENFANNSRKELISGIRICYTVCFLWPIHHCADAVNY